MARAAARRHRDEGGIWRWAARGERVDPQLVGAEVSDDEVIVDDGAEVGVRARLPVDDGSGPGVGQVHRLPEFAALGQVHRSEGALAVVRDVQPPPVGRGGDVAGEGASARDRLTGDAIVAGRAADAPGRHPAARCTRRCGAADAKDLSVADLRYPVNVSVGTGEEGRPRNLGEIFPIAGSEAEDVLGAGTDRHIHRAKHPPSVWASVRAWAQPGAGEKAPRGKEG